LLRYVVKGEVPTEKSVAEQSTRLSALRRSLELSGAVTYDTADGSPVPLKVSLNGKHVVVYVHSALLTNASRIPRDSISISDYDLLRDLPDAHRQVMAALGSLPSA
jgi:hypothetical protein